MPEQAEIRIISDFFNKEIAFRDVIKVEKSPLSKNKCDLSILENKQWKITARHRGKEMILDFSNNIESHHLKINFSKIGSLEYYDINEEIEDIESFDKRAVLRFYTDDKLYFISDFTRYTLWRWSNEWDTRRSPDIVTEHNKWRDHLFEHRKIKYFKRPIFEIFTDQRFFNGIGNFSRSEILARMRFSPFTNFNEILENDILRNEFFNISREVLDDIARLGGMQFKYWTNPFKVSKRGFNKWVRCYNKMPKSFFTKDSKGKVFWFMKEWLRDYALWSKEDLNVPDNDVRDTALLIKIYKKNIK